MNTNKMVVAFVMILLGFTVIFMLLPRHRCGDENDVVLQNLTDRAMSGDLVAISALYKRANEEGVRPFQEYWAYRGAMEGDAHFRKQYVELYHHLENEEKERILENIRKEMNHPGAKCLLATLTDNAVKATCSQ